MDLSALVNDAKQSVLSTLEEQIYQQAERQDLADTVLKSLVESAVSRLQVEMPAVTGVAGALLGLLQPLAAQASSLGLDQQFVDLLKRNGVDTAMKQRIIQGLSRYLEANGERLMSVAFSALIEKLSRPQG